jgi:hypothetical protein
VQDQDGHCDPDCQQQIDRLQDDLDRLPLQTLAELPDWQREIEDRLQECCQPDEQPGTVPPHQHTECPPDCVTLIQNIQNVVNNFPTQVEQYVNNYYNTVIQPEIERIREIIREELVRPLECVVIRLCQLAREQLGSMLECWFMADTPPAEGPLEVGILAAAPSDVYVMQEQGIAQQSTGPFALGILRARSIQEHILADRFPVFEDIEGQPDAIGFGVIDETAEIRIRSVGLRPGESDPCAFQEAA